MKHLTAKEALVKIEEQATAATLHNYAEPTKIDMLTITRSTEYDINLKHKELVQLMVQLRDKLSCALEEIAARGNNAALDGSKASYFAMGIDAKIVEIEAYKTIKEHIIATDTSRKDYFVSHPGRY